VNFIPGFRSKTKWKMIIASIYYLLSLSALVSSFGTFLIFLALPFVVFGLMDMIKYKEKKAIVTFVAALVVLIIGASITKPSEAPTETAKTMTPTANEATTKTNDTSKDNIVTNTEKTTKPDTTIDNKDNNLKRTVIGSATDLGAGTFIAGRDIKVGTYDATAPAGQGNFIINSSDGALITNEILGNSNGVGVNKVRVVLSDGWQIKISNLNKVHFEPVVSNSVPNKQQITLYSGYWLVGLDIAPGRYIAGNNVSSSSNFIVYDSSGIPKVNEIISNSSDIGVKQVTIDLNKGDIINISGSNGITLIPQ